MSDLTLTQAASQFAATVKEPLRHDLLVEVNRFVHWFGPEHGLNTLRGHGVSLYADVLGPATAEASRRADHVRTFLVYLKKEGLTPTNLGTHLRLRKGGVKGAARAASAQQGSVELTQAGIDALKAELESLGVQRIAVRADIGLAMLDKDFRENSPLDAAKDRQGHIEARIREIEAMLKRAVVVEDGASAGRVGVGVAVDVRNLGTGTTRRYFIVGPTEANAADGKISSDSPVGKALLTRGVGDEVEVSAPAGVLRFKIEAIEG